MSRVCANKRIELLAPAGSYETFKAVLRAGADAVYLAGRSFGARAYAGNLSNEELHDAIDEAHLFGRSVYLTVNTLVKDSEFEELEEFLRPLYIHGLDGVIVQDHGVMELLALKFPEMEIHASTQMTVTDEFYPEFLKKYGVTRIVPARELSVEEVKQIKKASGMEVECFAHGAICYAYSGGCLMSSFIGGRSGNRGRCAQPCRLPFTVDGKTGTWLSRRDLCTLAILPELVAAGIDSLKIEGRMRSPEYGAGVTSIYRKYIDRLYEEMELRGIDTQKTWFTEDEEKTIKSIPWKVDKKDLHDLDLLFFRGKTTNGFDVFSHENMCERKHAAIVSKKADPLPIDEKKALELDIHNAYVAAGCEHELKLPVDISTVVMAEAPMVLTLTCGDVSATEVGSDADYAKKSALTMDELKKRFSKFGGTCFEMQDFHAELDSDAFAPVGALNSLRRDALDTLRSELLAPFKRTPAKGQGSDPQTACEENKSSIRRNNRSTDSGRNGMIAAEVISSDQAMAAVEAGADRVIMDMESFSPSEICQVVRACEENGAEHVIALPAVFRQETLKRLDKDIDRIINELSGNGSCPSAWLVKTIGELEYLKKKLADADVSDARIIADSSCYVMNERSEAVLSEAGISEVTCSLEMNSHELEQTERMIRSESGHSVGTAVNLVVYGRAPLMTSANCVRGDVSGGRSCPAGAGSFTYMKDRKGAELPVRSVCKYGYSVIYNSVPTYLADLVKASSKLDPDHLVMVFTDENASTVKKIVKAVRANAPEAPDKLLKGKFTRGHFKRGIE